jgi:hypothetical protein
MTREVLYLYIVRICLSLPRCTTACEPRSCRKTRQQCRSGHDLSMSRPRPRRRVATVHGQFESQIASPTVSGSILAYLLFTRIDLSSGNYTASIRTCLRPYVRTFSPLSSVYLQNESLDTIHCILSHALFVSILVQSLLASSVE